MKKVPTTLAIDTSCDETSASVVDGFTVLSNIQPSQMKYHKKYGGVVPSLAKFAHIERIDNVIKEALSRSKLDWDNIDSISVTLGPGLSVALNVGVQKAKELAKLYKKPLVTINHMEGHLLSSLLEKRKIQSKGKDIRSYRSHFQYKLKKISSKFPVLGFLISGGHTQLVLVKGYCKYEVVGKKLDDSAGEAYDKCGRIIGLGYPAGPVITKFAQQHRKNIKFFTETTGKTMRLIGTNINSGAKYSLPISMLHSNDLNMSYSGLKTAFMEIVDSLTNRHITVKDQLNKRTNGLSKTQIMDLTVVFEESVILQLLWKLEKAIQLYNPHEIWLGGGVIASPRIRSRLRSLAAKFNISIKYPYSNKLMTDNAAMIGLAANLRFSILNNEANAATAAKYNIFYNNYGKIERSPRLSL